MIRLARTAARRIRLIAAGALLSSTAGIATAAPTPAMTPNAPLTIADWQANVGAQLDAHLVIPARALVSHDHRIAILAVSLDRDGAFAGARVTRSSGHAGVDANALRAAREIAYPPLPAGYRGRPRTIVMQAYFGEAATPQEAMRQQEAVEALASRPAPSHDAVQTAAIPRG